MQGLGMTLIPHKLSGFNDSHVSFIEIIKTMQIQFEDKVSSLGNETRQILGFETEEELEAALLPLIQEINPEELIAA